MEARLVSCRVLDVDGNGVSSHDSRVLMSVINKVRYIHYRTDSMAYRNRCGLASACARPEPYRPSGKPPPETPARVSE